MQAQVPGRGHGLRKAAAVRVLENGGTVDQLKAIFGQVTNQQPELYVREANGRRLGSTGPAGATTQDGQSGTNVAQDRPEGVSQAAETLGNADVWRPVGESNPCFQRERLAS